MYGNCDTVVIRYSTNGGVHLYESCYKPILLNKMACFELVIGGYDGRNAAYGIGLHVIRS